MYNLSTKKTSIIFGCLCLFIKGNSQINKQLERSSTNYCLCQNQDTTNSIANENTASYRILDIGMNMALISKTIIIGSCWDFVNEVYKRAGVANTKKTIFKSKQKGPYAKPNLVKPGDWVYHINKNYNDVNLWWYSNKTQSAIKEFALKFSKTTYFPAFNLSRLIKTRII